MSRKKNSAVEPEVKSQVPSPTDVVSQLAAALQGTRRETLMVGIRNISGSTLGLESFGNGPTAEPSISLHPWNPADPNCMAVVTHARWREIRKGRLFAQGLLERYDDILDEGVGKAPADRPQDLHPDHEKNRLPEPVAFIEATPDDEMREKLLAMTSENQLQRIIGVVDRRHEAIYAEYRDKGDPNAKERALADLPPKYQMAERYARMRLDQLSPVRADDGLKPFRRV